MISTGLSEDAELEGLRKIISELQQSKEAKLRLVYPAKNRRNDSNKITICGGSYNPFHSGHRELIHKTLEFIDGSEAIAYITLTHSLGKPFIGADYAQRLYMLKIEQERLPFMSVAVINDGFYKNWFHRLREFHPDETNKYFCVMGADLFPKIVNGNCMDDYQKIFSIDWLIAERSEKNWTDFAIPDSVKPFLDKIKSVALDKSVSDVSSTKLREMIAFKDPKIVDFIQKDHLDFIIRHKIYSRYIQSRD
jgi:nicotinic acid mononucleotide adenylyltransferase